MTAFPFPTRGGSFVRDPGSGALRSQDEADTPTAEPEAEAEEQTAPTPDTKRKGGK